MYFLMRLFTVVALAAVSLAFPDGAPGAACYTMVPGHFPSTVSGAAPFSLNISSMSYQPGSKITGTLASTSGQTFTGFMLLADVTNNPLALTTPTGTFDIVDATQQQTVCGTGNTQGLTHKDGKSKTVVNFSWTAPAQVAGDIYFRATVVQGFQPSVFWLGIFSPRVKAT